MLFVILILAAGALGGLISLRRLWNELRTRRQRSRWLRVFLFSSVALLLLGALWLPLPGKFRLLAVAPLFALVAITYRVLRGARARVEVEAQRQPDIESMKRLN